MRSSQLFNQDIVKISLAQLSFYLKSQNKQILNTDLQITEGVTPGTVQTERMLTRALQEHKLANMRSSKRYTIQVAAIKEYSLGLQTVSEHM